MIDINNFETWPSEVKKYLVTHVSLLKKLCSKSLSYRESEPLAPVYDEFLRGLKSVLASYKIHGYHCTRLTKDEIDIILNKGMTLPDSALLNSRINKLSDARMLSKNNSNKLITNNEADDPYRKYMLWFCFFRPALAGESGIREFFKYWGGEALFNSQDPELKEVLGNIGIPCIIEACLPIKGFDFMEIKFTNKYKHYLQIEAHHEDYEVYSVLPVSATDIIKIFTYPSKDFIDLTNCNEWEMSI